MRRILVTGSAGYLGGEIVRAAAAAGLEPVGTWHRRPVEGGVRVNVRDGAAVARAVAEVRPDAVIHAAYTPSGPDLWEVTAVGAGVVARAAAEAGIRHVHVSSDVVFDGEKGSPYTERDAVGPVHDYGRAKAGAERFVKTLHPAAAIARSALIVGGPPGNPQERLVASALDGSADVTFFTDEIRTPVEVGDLARALVELSGNDWVGPIHLGGSDVVSRFELASLLAGPNAAGRLRSGRSADAPGRRPRNCSLDSSLAGAMLTTRLRGAREVLSGR